MEGSAGLRSLLSTVERQTVLRTVRGYGGMGGEGCAQRCTSLVLASELKDRSVREGPHKTHDLYSSKKRGAKV